MQVSSAIAAIGCWLLLIAPTHAQQANDGSAPHAAPPVENASFHQLVFANDDIRVLNNLYPPGGDSGFHAHDHDLFSVVIQAAPSSSQRPGQALVAAPAVAVGDVGYSAVGGGRRVHRVVQGDGGPAQYIVIEMRRAAPSGNAVASRAAVPAYAQVLDNNRVRAWRLVLAPGASAPAITQGANGVRVVVRGGLLTTSAPGLPEQTLWLRPGDVALQRGGSVRALRNSGADTIELVELELK